MSSTLTLQTLPNGNLDENAYLLSVPGNSAAILIDPGSEAQKLDQAITASHLKPALILATHGHFDHVGQVDYFQKKYAAPFGMHAGDRELLHALPDNYAFYGMGQTAVPTLNLSIEDGQMLEAGPLRLRAIHTPGHSPGGLCFYHKESGSLFSGDTLFRGSVGRSDFPGGSHAQLTAAIREKLLRLPGHTKVYPGHGPATTLEEEKTSNPFLA